MNLLATILLYISCQAGVCHFIEVSPEAAAIAACESGDTVTLGSVDWNAVGYNGKWSTDGGAWKINDYWVWSSKDRWAIIPVANNVFDMSSTEFLRRWPSAEAAPPYVQYEMFKYLWNDGYGWRNWSASQPCWSQWLTIEKGRAVWKN